MSILELKSLSSVSHCIMKGSFFFPFPDATLSASVYPIGSYQQQFLYIGKES